jgi:uncharacterized tellurite resistance protein B-like protein
MRRILQLLGLDPAGAPAEDDTIRRIADELDRLDPERARYIAVFAYILSRVARADQDVSPVETAAMERIVMDTSGLPRDQVIMVVQIAKTQHLLMGGTEDYGVTREFDRRATHEQKLALVECLFAVSASDDSILTVEDNEIVKISRELKIEHADVVRLRSRYRDKVEAGKEWRREK